MAEAIRDTLAASKAQRNVRRAAREAPSSREPERVNPRVWKMFEEAIQFKTDTIHPFQNKLADLELGTLDFFDAVLPLLHAPLPRVWAAVEGGLAEPLRATVSHKHPHIAGGDMDDAALRLAVREFEARLQLKVRRPLAQWVGALDSVRDRFPELERLRASFEKRVSRVARQEVKAEQESRTSLGVKRGARGISVRGRKPGRGARRGLRGALYRCVHPSAVGEEEMSSGAVPLAETEYERGGESLGAGGEPSTPGAAGARTAAEPATPFEESPEMAAQEFKREERGMKLKDRQRKLAVARETFMGEEGLLYEQLAGLCRDAAWTKSYVAAALLMAKELMQESVFNLGSTLQPLPSIKTPPEWQRGHAAAPAGEEEATSGGPLVPGQLGSNVAFNAAMPEFATRARARATLEDLKAAAARRLRTTRVTAAPLEVHASLHARTGERTATPRLGSPVSGGR